MAINSNCFLREKKSNRTICLSSTSNFKTDSFSNSKSNRSNNNNDLISPYLHGDKVHMLSEINGKKQCNKSPTPFISSFPLAVSVYKANSDEIKLSKRANKKVKKSVLTLPNEPIPKPRPCTVSDFNDSEYFNDSNDNRITKQKKHKPVKRSKKPRTKERALEYYDRDAHYCSQMNIDLDCSSSEFVNFNGDVKRISKVAYRSNNSAKTMNDVWAILKNINKLPFMPPRSQEYVLSVKKRKPLIQERKGLKRNNAHFVETCHTEEFSYVSSFEVDGKSRGTCSPSSSFDRVTVIGKTSDQDDIMKISRKNVSQPGSDNKVSRISKIRKKTDMNKTIARTMHNKICQVEGNVISNFRDKPLLPKRHVIVDKSSDVSINSESCYGSVIKIAAGIKPLPNNDRNVFNSCNDNKDNELKKIDKYPNAKGTITKPNSYSVKQISGITKVIWNKGQDVLSSLSKPLRKPRLGLPYLTQTEIKKRLANLKFPIVILGKDQLTNRAIHVANYDSPQFNGLNQHIWPFMAIWCEKKSLRHCHDKHAQSVINIIIPKNSKFTSKVDCLESDLCDSHICVSKADKLEINYFSSVNNKNTQHLASDKLKRIRKPKPINISKNTEFQCLGKKDSQRKPNERSWNNHGRLDTVRRQRIIYTGVTDQSNYDSSMYGPQNVLVNKPVENRFVKNSYPSSRQPWAKVTVESAFVEDIIKKISNGVYYCADQIDGKNRMNNTEISTQTETNITRNAYCQNSNTRDKTCLDLNKKDDPLNQIPGFDKTYSTLEIVMISKNQIAVKQRVTNIVVYFDIQISTEATNVMPKSKSASCTPIHIKGNQERIFKFNTSILNAILPAELCTIIPNMMQNILDADTKLSQPSATIEKFESLLTNTSKIARLERPAILQSSLRELMSHKIRPMLNGRCTLLNFKHGIHDNILNINSLINRIKLVDNLFPRVNARLLWCFIQPTVILNAFKKSFNEMNMASENSTKTSNSYLNCTALQTYEPRNLRIIPTFGFFNFNYFIKEIINKLNLNERSYTNNLKITTYGCVYHRSNNALLTKPTILLQDIDRNPMLLANINKVWVISLYEGFKSNENIVEVAPQTCRSTVQTDIEKKSEAVSIYRSNKIDLRKKWRPIKIVRKKSYIKCYRKCISLSSISNYKCTPLNKVTNLDEFCQVLGSNSLSSVLGGCPEKKILGAIREMRNWITEINCKQALLVLLLANKKDTPNLIRFRPVLLQGIAVNRITKAIELDTEIEVIERENFNKLSKVAWKKYAYLNDKAAYCMFEGTSYLPASVENQENLLEELCWIAKTTASDYKKTFDESLEHLLKSLLEKEKS